MKEHHLAPDIAYEVDALGARMLMVREGMGVTIFESSGLVDARRDPSLFVLQMSEPVAHRLVWVDAEGQDRGPMWRAFAHHVKREIVQLREELLL
jgi:hypothetical protein